MKIIIEGCDGTGKTTLAKMLASHTQADYIHCERKDPNDYDYYFQTMRKHNYVFDRHFIGEMVYPSVFNRTPKLNEKQFQDLLFNAKINGVFVIILYSTDEKISENNKNDQYPEVAEKALEINKKFIEIAERNKIPKFDILNDGFEKVLNYIYAIR